MCYDKHMRILDRTFEDAADWVANVQIRSGDSENKVLSDFLIGRYAVYRTTILETHLG